MLSTCARAILCLIALTVMAAAAIVESPLDEASALQQQGKLKEARDRYHAAAEEFRTTGDQQNLAVALSAAGGISISLGDYGGAINDVERAVQLRRALHDNDLANDLNTLGRAYQYLGNYAAALDHYEQALKSDRSQGDLSGEVTRLNNIGTIYFYLGQYSTALESYETALKIVDANAGQIWQRWGKKLTTGNIATVYDRLGLEEKALDLYRQNSGKPDEMAPEEYAQLLLNEGVLYRHMGDPVKALELYQTSQGLFRTSHQSDGEISALRNIGIVKATDLADLSGAIQSFTSALELAQKSSNERALVQANLYLGDVFRRLGQSKAASAHLNTALEVARKIGLVEEQWKALYSLGRIEEQTGDPQAAAEDYQRAISIIESVRAGLRVPSLKIDFLADKRDVYDSLIALHLQQPDPPIAELFQWMERSRARTLLERMSARTSLNEASIKLVQSHLPPETVFVEFWIGPQNGIALWITSDKLGIVRYPSAGALRSAAEKLLLAVQSGGNGWKQLSQDLGASILNGIPIRRHLILVPDGPLNLPFEILTLPGSENLLIEQSDVTYLPSARFLTLHSATRSGWLFPWSRELVAIGDPLVSSNDLLAEQEQWRPLQASADEVRGVASAIPGKAELHLGADARKTYLLAGRLRNLPLLHISTHAVVDTEHPDRSRILLTAESPNTPDYLFQEEVNGLDLRNVGLVTVSACDTARGKLVTGEGVQAFSQSFLAAGASATIASMWKVADAPTASFMKQLYYSLGQGASKAEALRAAKLRFLHSNSDLAMPRYWAAFVLNGDGWEPTVYVIPWSTIFLALSALLALVALILWRILAAKAAKTRQRRAQPSQ